MTSLHVEMKTLLIVSSILCLLSSVKSNYYPGFPMASPWVHTPQMDPFANMGLALSAYPPPKISTFSPDWKTSGYKTMYNLNYMAPYGMDVASHGHGHAPLTSQLSYNNLTSYLNNGQMNPYGYNLADPRYHALYQRYYNFFNKDLNLLGRMVPPKNTFDINKIGKWREAYPKNFDYKRSWDDLAEASMPPTTIKAFGTRQDNEERRLLQIYRVQHPIRSNLLDFLTCRSNQKTVEEEDAYEEKEKTAPQASPFPRAKEKSQVQTIIEPQEI